MTDSQQRGIGVSMDFKPHAYDPVLTPLVLVVGLLNERQRLLHDIMLGTVVINNPVRARVLRMTRPPV
jgi:uncharacterized RDD family membrane protein YckC